MFQLVLNGLGGKPLQRLIRSKGDLGALRPWAETDKYGNLTGNCFVTLNQKRQDGSLILNDNGEELFYNVPIENASTTIRTEDWQEIDRTVEVAARPRLKFFGMLRARVPRDIPNAMGKPTIGHTVRARNASATISMDPARKGERARAVMDTTLTPLPIIHSDGTFTMRDIAISEQGQIPLDTTAIEDSTDEVATTVEKLALGLSGTYSWGGGTVYGLTNFPQRSTKTLTAPSGGWTPDDLLVELLDMIKILEDDEYHGPYVAFYSRAWNPIFALDYNANYARSIRSRLQEGLPQISSWEQIDYLTGYQIILVQMERRVLQGVQGMPITTVRWEEPGGWEEAFKVLCIQQALFKSDANGAAGICHGAVP